MISQYIYDLLLENDYVAVPGLGGFVCQYQSAVVDRHRSLISPPARTIAFNKALHQNDGLLIQHVVLKDVVSYKDAEDKIRSFVAQCNQQLHQIGSIQFPGIGRLYMDELKNIQFTPSQESLPLDESFGLSNLIFVPVSRKLSEEPVLVDTEDATPVVHIQSAQKRWPYWVAASFAGVFIVGSMWLNLGQTSLSNAMTAGIFSGSTVQITSQQNELPMDNSQIKAESIGVLTLKKPAVEEVQENEIASMDALPDAQEYSIVVGAFKGPITAEKYKLRLQEQGYTVETLKTSPNTFVKVVVKFNANSEEEALAAIRTNVEKDAWVLN